jgi:hypothetical protein
MRILRAEKIRVFFRNKIKEIFKTCQKTKTIDEVYSELKESKIKMPGFTTNKHLNTYLTKNNKTTQEVYSIKNASGNGCEVMFKYKVFDKKKLYVDFCLDDRKDEWHIRTSTGSVYQFLEQLESLEKEYRAFAADAEKEEKINTIARDSIQTWLKAILNGTPYSYYTEEAENKITLCIRLKNQMQLNIPVYYKSFQKIMPELLLTIQQYENTANHSKIKVLIGNSPVKAQWIKE